MNKELKPSNYTFCEHFKLYGYLSPTMIEELLDKVDDLEHYITQSEHDNDETNNEMIYWRKKYESII